MTIAVRSVEKYYLVRLEMGAVALQFGQNFLSGDGVGDVLGRIDRETRHNGAKYRRGRVRGADNDPGGKDRFAMIEQGE